MKRFQRAFAFLLLVALVFAGAAAAEENGKLQVHFLRIGRNDGILISMNGETAFIDGGSRYHGNVAADYMEKLGVTHLNYYIGTHAHSDHVGAACSLLARIPADEILYTYSLAVDCMLDSARTAEEKRVIRETPRRTLAYGDEFTVGAATLRVMGPKAYKPRASYKDGLENENSLILRLEYGSVSFLLCADTTNGVLKALLKEDPSLMECTVLKSPHHNVGLRTEVYDCLKTDYMIFSTSSKYPPERAQINKARRAGADHKRRQRGNRGVHDRRRKARLYLRKRGRQVEGGQEIDKAQEGADQERFLRHAQDDQHAVLRIHRREHRDRRPRAVQNHRRERGRMRYHRHGLRRQHAHHSRDRALIRASSHRDENVKM